MTDERVNLSPLTPSDEAEERMLRNIRWRTRAELARRAAQRIPLVELMAGLARPAILVAASIAGISIALLAMFDDGSRAEAATGAYMPASEVPAAALSWYEENREPTVDDLLVVSIQER